MDPRSILVIFVFLDVEINFNTKDAIPLLIRLIPGLHSAHSMATWAATWSKCGYIEIDRNIKLLALLQRTGNSMVSHATEHVAK